MCPDAGALARPPRSRVRRLEAIRDVYDGTQPAVVAPALSRVSVVATIAACKLDPMPPMLDALLGADPWVELLARRDLLDTSADPSLVARIAADPRVAELIDATDPWPPGRRSTKAYDPKDAIWKVGVLADFGLTRTDPRIDALAERLFAAAAPDGTFRHGGFDHTKTYDLRGYTCVTHAATGSLARFGYREDPRLLPATEHIRATQRLDGGWHPNPALQPGVTRESEPSCPFGTLQILRAAAAVGGELLDRVGPPAAGYLLDCWVRREAPFRPVGFGMGTTFAKLTYPFATFGILGVVDALTAVRPIRTDPRLVALVDAVVASRREDGYLAATVSGAWAEFDFGQKREPSPWITAIVLRAVRRMGFSRPAGVAV